MIQPYTKLYLSLEHKIKNKFNSQLNIQDKTNTQGKQDTSQNKKNKLIVH